MKELIGWVGRMLARFVGLMFVLYGLLLTVTNVVELIQGTDYSGPWWVIPWILGSGVASLAGGALFILTFDGPQRFTTRGWRSMAIGLMFLASILPTAVTSIVIVLVLMTIPSLWLGLASPGESKDSSRDG